MKELVPLAQASNNARTRALLRAGQVDGPPPDFANKLMLGLGVAGAATGVSWGAAAGASATGAAQTGAVKVGSGAASWLLAAKWVAVGVMGGGILASGTSAVLSPSPARPVVPLPKASAAPPPAQPALGGAPPLVAVVPSAAPSAPAWLGKSAEKTAVSAPPSATSGQLGREVVQMDRARAALASGDAARCLVELDGFDRLAQTGVLDREARVLRIEALHRLGKSAEARSLAQRYVQTYPHDAHAARLRALVGDF